MENKFKHLKNLNIEELVGNNINVKPSYNRTLEVAKNIRNAFASSKANLLNFVNSLSELEDKIHASVNENELNSFKDQLLGLVNTFNVALIASFSRVRKYVNIKLDTSRIDNPENVPNSSSLYLKTDIPGSIKASIICSIPGMLLHINNFNERVVLKISQPKYMGIDDPEFTVMKEYILLPSLFVEYDTGSEEVFNDGTTVKKLLQSMINYNDVPNLENLTNEDEPFYNEIAGALDFFDKNIEAMENAHKSITNMANIDS